MQKLRYETSWEKQISEKDRILVEHTFQNTQLNINEPIQFTTLRTAKNYKDELLVMVIVHNTMNEDFQFIEELLYVTLEGEIIGEHVFTLPNLIVKQKTSMPWTFIFPKGSFKSEVELTPLQLTRMKK